MTRSRYIADKEKARKTNAALVMQTKLLARRELSKGLARMERVLVKLPRVESSADNREKLLSAYNRNTVKDGLTKVLDNSIEKSIKIAIKPVLVYLEGCFQDAGIDKDIKPAFDRLESRLYKKLKASNYKPVPVVKNRTGFNLSPSVWDAVDGFSDRILAIIEAELAKGTDPVKIARILEEYVAAGTPEKILGRWGKLEIGTPEYRKRLGTSGADYRTQRVVRTEMYNAIRTADIESGAMNPASTGMFNWILSPSHIDSGCDCPERAAGSPYTKEQATALKDESHPNCFPAGTLVDTPFGRRRIEDVIPGDVVISASGNARKVTNTFKSLYDGEMVEMTTSKVSVKSTIDHIFLSDGVFVSAHNLKKGDDLISVQRGLISSLFAKYKPFNTPSIRLKKRSFIRVLELLSPVGVPVAAIDFNGKLYVLKCDVNVVLVNGKVNMRAFSEFLEGAIESGLVRTAESAIASGRPTDKFIMGTLFPSNGGMGRLRVGDTPICVASVMPFGYTGDVISETLKPCIDSNTGHVESLCYLINREILIDKKPSKFFKVNFVSRLHHNVIVSYKREKVKCFVYNITVEKDHTFIANGFATHNCFCLVNPVLLDHDTFMAQLKDYANGNNTEGGNRIAEWVDSTI